MNRPSTFRQPPSALQAIRMAPASSADDTDALLASASEDDLELALRLVAWNRRDLGQFLKARAPR